MATRNPLLDKVVDATRNAESAFIAELCAPAVDVQPRRMVDRVADDAPIEYEFDYKKRGAKTYRGAGLFDGRRGKGQYPQTLPRYFEDATGSAREYSFGSTYDLHQYEQLTPQMRRELDETDTRQLTHALLIAKELDFVEFLKSSTFSNGATGSGDGYWDDANTDPTYEIVKGVGSVHTAGFGHPNVLALSYEDAVSLSFNPKVRALNGDQEFTVATLALRLRDSILALSNEVAANTATDFRVVIGSALYDSGDVIESAEGSYIWAGCSALMYVPSQADLSNPSAAYHARVAPPAVKTYDEKKLHRTEITETFGRISPVPELAYIFEGMTENPVSA